MFSNRVKTILFAVVGVNLFFSDRLLTGADQPRFEVASVKRTSACGGGRFIDSRSVTLSGVPLKPILTQAFQVRADQVEGPSWLEADCFDISAKIPVGESLEHLPAMLQALLRERFKLAVHNEERSRTGYALVVDEGGPKFKEDTPKANFLGSHAGQMFYGAAGRGALKGAMTMATLAANLSTKGYGHVQDLTGLTGKYDIDLSWEPNPEFESTGALVGPSADAGATAGNRTVPETAGSLFSAVRKSLGLRLERRRIQVQFLIIDHIDRTPTEN